MFGVQPISTTDILVVLIFWLVVWNRWSRQCSIRIPTITKTKTNLPENPPRVSIILPARNEAHQIATPLNSLLAQDYPDFEIIVVDDGSEDGTGELLKEFSVKNPNLTSIQGEPLPEGWMGKAHAMHQGYEAANGDWFLFTDAHTVHAPSILSKAMSLILPSPASFATALAKQREPGLGVYLVNLAVFGYLFMVTDLKGFLDPRSRHSLVNDQYLLISREAYEDIGTHEAVRQFSSNDAAFGYLAKLKGYLPLVIHAGEALQTTMYTTASRAFRGWSRSLVNGAWTVLGPASGSAVLVMVTVGLSFFWIVPWLTWLDGMDKQNVVQTVVGVSQLLAVLSVLLMMAGGRLRKALADWIAMPFSFIIFAAMVATGLLRAGFRGGTVQKGRVVKTRRSLPPWKPGPVRPRRG